MPTLKHRLTISLTDDEYEAVSRMARIQDVPRSRIISEMLAEVCPMLMSMADMAEQALAAQNEVRASLRRAVDVAEADMLPQIASIYDRLDALRSEMREVGGAARSASAPAGRAAMPDPRPVTRGSRTQPRDRGKGLKRGSSHEI